MDAPIDDEPLTKEEIETIEEGKKDIEKGRVKPLKDFIKELEI